MMKATKDNIFFAAAFTLVVMWQMLLPGYVIALDMFFTPHIALDLSNKGFYNDLPLRLVPWFMNLFMTGWIVQKLLLIAMFFFLAFLAVRFLSVPKERGANYWAALFFSLNPFVYERFLAGQWTVVFAYACLPPLIHHLLGFFEASSYRRLCWILFWVLLIGVFSLHFLVIAVLTVAACFLVRFVVLIKKKGELVGLMKFAGIFAALFLAVSSYWLVPYFLDRQSSVLNVFNSTNQAAFRTAGANGAQTAFNVLTLYGFWIEEGDWNGFFLSPRDHVIFWSAVLVALAAIIIFGIRRTFKEKRGEVIFFALLALAAFVFSCGLGEGVFKGVNAWLFDHIGFWRGFRDTQKWSGLLALAYAYFGGWGYWHVSCGILRLGSGQEWRIGTATKKIIIALIFCIPVLYTYTMVGGFARQLKPVWYPQSWYQVKEKLDADQSGGRVLFLPWHQYMSLYFNQNIVSTNPAKGFFGSRIVAGDNIEVGGVFSQSTDKENLAIQDVIIDETLAPDEAIKWLEKEEIRYILVMNEAISRDYLNYPVLGSKLLQPAFQSEDLTLYEIKKYNK
jgi:hypothetical protein